MCRAVWRRARAGSGSLGEVLRLHFRPGPRGLRRPGTAGRSAAVTTGRSRRRDGGRRPMLHHRRRTGPRRARRARSRARLRRHRSRSSPDRARDRIGNDHQHSRWRRNKSGIYRRGVFERVLVDVRWHNRIVRHGFRVGEMIGQIRGNSGLVRERFFCFRQNLIGRCDRSDFRRRLSQIIDWRAKARPLLAPRRHRGKGIHPLHRLHDGRLRFHHGQLGEGDPGRQRDQNRQLDRNQIRHLAAHVVRLFSVTRFAGGFGAGFRLAGCTKEWGRATAKQQPAPGISWAGHSLARDRNRSLRLGRECSSSEPGGAWLGEPVR